jgi:methionyl aminopeptidase
MGPVKQQQRVLLNERERQSMRNACSFNAQLMDYLRPHVREGISTGELDRLAEDYTRQHGHVPACLGYRGYPKTICTSVNEVVCHGIPGDYTLKSGDIVNVDITTIVDGWYGDQSETFLVGEVSDEARELTQVTFDCLWLGIHAIKPFCKVTDIGRAIERHAHAHRFSVVREYQGHGIGQSFHQDPGIPHYVPKHGPAPALLPGMCFTVEPMINAGDWRTELDRTDGWTVRTRDRRLSAQFEHTILLTETGPEVLTLTQNGPQEGHKF